MRPFSSLLLAASLVVGLSAAPALADDWHHGDIHSFHEHGFDHWRGGSWFNGFHEGRNGWWWIVDGSWYFYPAPVYPYPDPYTPPGVVVEAPAVVGVPPSYAYYCNRPAGYYPYVPECFGHWHRVATGSAVVATPAPAQTIIVQTPPAAPANPHDADLQQINAYAAAFEGISPQDPQALSKLKDLDKQVAVFRETLSKRDYNTVDIYKDTEDMHKRIEAQKKKLVAAHKAEAAPPPAPAPQAIAPGTAVTFSPQ